MLYFVNGPPNFIFLAPPYIHHNQILGSFFFSFAKFEGVESQELREKEKRRMGERSKGVCEERGLRQDFFFIIQFILIWWN
jgi:hypothetical protein